MIDEALREAAQRVLDASPCSLEMPAGTGKTHLLAAAASLVSEQHGRSLILTHTNAGVDALSKRLHKFGVPSSAVHIETITGWAFALVRAYSGLAGLVVPESPDWTASGSYIAGAARVAKADAIIRMHAASFDYFFVDEYQDCNEAHHLLIEAISMAIPRTIVLGDRLQGIFGFAEPLIDWDTHVLPRYPALSLEHIPHRWLGHNELLGDWLLSQRPNLVHGARFDIANHSVPGLSWVEDVDGALHTTAYSFTDYGETVLLLDKWASGAARHASRLGGVYVVIEDVAGRFMREQLERLPSEGTRELAVWLAVFVKACTVGLGSIDSPILGKLGLGQSITHYSRPGLEPVLGALDSFRQAPSYKALLETAEMIRAVDGVRIYRWEAWNDTLEAIELSLGDGQPPIEHLARVRDRLRKLGRRRNARIASTTLLVKGLEYDHVIIADLSGMLDPRNLYVALSRARKSVTVIGSSSSVVLQNEN
ncbi:DEAD/DEAH box helicase [Cryobacterium lyxosi]|uniref:(+)RNA virus helicase C-terminal domain-containing protein n=1 Tax=Cryobacterium lyxosi TaxID=1259228 RepID=A0A4R8ZGM0_9MICO|nr:UvrD-helicase domain-containing protein [Cryobacterium lyxosi]TFD27357.1 hypothetical protein E3T27_06265 [Cryobacterium lyxosi]